MHGGAIYIRGELEPYQLGLEVGQVPLDDADWDLLRELVGAYCRHFDLDEVGIFAEPFTKLVPLSLRPYGRLYAY
jgi:glutamate synthase domain-containing protein 3